MHVSFLAFPVRPSSSPDRSVFMPTRELGFVDLQAAHVSEGRVLARDVFLVDPEETFSAEVKVARALLDGRVGHLF